MREKLTRCDPANLTVCHRPFGRRDSDDICVLCVDGAFYAVAGGEEGVEPLNERRVA